MKKNTLKHLLFFGLSTLICANAQSQNAELLPITEFDNAAITSISENGDWACGSAFNNADGAGFQSNASKWNLTTGERTHLVPEDELDVAQSDAFCISNDGTLVGGQYLSQPAYNLNGEWHVLPLPKGYTMGEVRDFAITNNDTIFIGRIFDGDGYQKIQSAQWIKGEFEKIADSIPEELQRNEDNNMMNQTTAISSDGKIILGAIRPVEWPMTAGVEGRVPFILKNGNFKLLSPLGREEFNKFGEDAVYFFKEEKLSHNGKFIALKLFANNIHLSCYYNVEQDKFILIEGAPEETGCLVVDNSGTPYYGGPISTGVDRHTYINKDGKNHNIDDVLKSAFGITQDQINATCSDEFLTGSLRWIYDISEDAKTIIGCAGEGSGTYNWVLKLPFPLIEGKITAIENITNNNLATFYANGNINFTDNVNHIEIFNANGQLLQSQEVTSSSIPTSLKQGTYIIKAYTANKQITTSKLIIK